MIRARRHRKTSHAASSTRAAAEGNDHSAPRRFFPLRLVPLTGAVPFVLDRARVVVGRQGDCDLCLAEPDVSRRHCRFEFAHGAWRVSDLGSLNGLRLNGERILSAEVHPGDRLEIGSAAFTVGDGARPLPASDAAHARLRSIVAGLARVEAAVTEVQRRV